LTWKTRVIKDDHTFGNERGGAKAPSRGNLYAFKFLLDDKMDNATELKNILLIRSATRILNPTIESLKNEFPDSKITVLAPESTREILEKHPDVDSMISTGNINRMNVFSLGNNIIRKIRRGAFGLAVSLYNIDHGMGYSNIDCLAWASGAKTIRGYNALGTFVEFNGWGVLKKYFLEKTSFAWLLINGIITVVLFIFITLGLLCEWTIRKIFSSNAKEKNPTAESQQTILPNNAEPTKIPQGLPPEVHQKV